MIQLIKIALVFIVILISLRYKINLGVTLAIAALLLLLFSAVAPIESLKIVIGTFGDYSNLNLMANIVCITILKRSFYTGQLKPIGKIHPNSF